MAVHAHTTPKLIQHILLAAMVLGFAAASITVPRALAAQDVPAKGPAGTACSVAGQSGKSVWKEANGDFPARWSCSIGAAAKGGPGTGQPAGPGSGGSGGAGSGSGTSVNSLQSATR